MIDLINKPNPGSKEAVEAGCQCPVIDNHYGRGHHGIEGEFIYNLECPLHNISVDEFAKSVGITLKNSTKP
jgi:hypothetical protein